MLIDEDGVYAEKPSAGECNVESVVWKDREAVALCCQQVTPGSQILGMDLGGGRDDR
jgi:hypothetical protein